MNSISATAESCHDHRFAALFNNNIVFIYPATSMLHFMQIFQIKSQQESKGMFFEQLEGF